MCDHRNHTVHEASTHSRRITITCVIATQLIQKQIRNSRGKMKAVLQLTYLSTQELKGFSEIQQASVFLCTDLCPCVYVFVSMSNNTGSRTQFQYVEGCPHIKKQFSDTHRECKSSIPF